MVGRPRERLEVSAPAKLNLTLEVLGRRTDGYHEVRTLLQTIDLCDSLELRFAPDLTVECDDAFLEGETNLVWRAAAALATYGNVQPRAHIFLRKRIPVGMGLGGGSSDAASALMALNELWGLHLGTEALARIAAGLGADVAFFLWGGTALATGRGEQIEPIQPLPAIPATLICPPSTIPDKTRRLYSEITPAQYSGGEHTARLAEILKAGQFVPGMIHNVFEKVCFQLFPELGELRQRVSSLAGSRPHLSGAGPALFCLPSTEDEYVRIANALKPTGVRVYLVRTVASQSSAVPG